MQTEGLEFRDAVERLAGDAGLEVPKDSPQEREHAERQANLGTVMEAACAFFERQLPGSPGDAYLKSRGLKPEAIKRFRLGFSPDSRTALKSHLQRLNIPEALGIESGMLIKPEDGGPSYDRFRGRVMFPIADARGRIVAFGGRVLGDEKPKYLNSPDTPLFSKGRQLYNLNLSQKAAREKKEVLVVEGYMDAIALTEAGFPVVASLGTALTIEQIEILWRLAPEPILCFDGDQAGQRAAAKVAERVLPALRPGLSLRFVNLVNDETGEKEDPDSFLRRHSPMDFRNFIEDRMIPLSGVLWQILQKDRKLDTPERRAALRSDVEHLTALITDRSVRDEYRIHFGGYLQDIFGAVVGAIRNAPGEKRKRTWAEPQFKGPQAKTYSSLEWRYLPSFHKNWGGEAYAYGLRQVRRLPYECMLATVIYHPALLSKYIELLHSRDFEYPDLDRLRVEIVSLATRHPDVGSTEFWTLLVQAGFAEVLQTLSARTRYIRFTLPTASDDVSERGMLHLYGVMTEKDLKHELELAGEAWAVDSTDENWRRFEALKNLVSEAETQRQDLGLLEETTQGAQKRFGFS
jgi:DNA primase